MEFFASCPAGFEGLLADELRALGTPRVRPLHGQVGFEGKLADAYRVCLWSRLASRVVAILARVGARTADELYEGVSQIAWEDELVRTATISVDAHGTNSELRNTRFTALRTKDAIADRMAEMCGVRLATDPSQADLTVIVRLSRERAVIGIELAGEPLFHRDGQRKTSLRESLRPDYAAALLATGGWYRLCRHQISTLLVLGAGAAVLLAEAQAECDDRAPNLLRHRWGFESWLRHDEAAWFALLDEADERAEKAAKASTTANFFDVGANGIDATQLGAADVLLCCDLSRAADFAESSRELAQARSTVAALPLGSTLSVLGRDKSLGVALSLEPTREERIYLGADEGVLAAYELKEDTRQALPLALKSGSTVMVELSSSEQFARRLEKTWRLRRRWARREDIGAYRVYDADLPDYAVAIERFEPSKLMDESKYGGTGGGPWAVLSEYAAPKEIDPALAYTRLSDALAITAPVLEVATGDVFVRQRLRARGGSQYANRQVVRDSAAKKGKLALAAGAHLVDEGGLTFELNFSGGLDVGLFLDTRDIRARIREMTKTTVGSKRFLNLFAYTGSASCYAADGGAKYTTTVDLSRPYLEWAERNMERNGFGGPEHEYVQADVLSWVHEQRHTRNRWDLIYLDPPTFSNSSRMKSSSFDIQRDHVELLIDVSRLLTRAGSCVFCCNLRGFVPEREKLAKAGVELSDITDQTIPEDFLRNKRIHHCYIVRRCQPSAV